jgi:hypothetical protein
MWPNLRFRVNLEAGVKITGLMMFSDLFRITQLTHDREKRWDLNSVLLETTLLSRKQSSVHGYLEKKCFKDHLKGKVDTMSTHGQTGTNFIYVTLKIGCTVWNGESQFAWWKNNEVDSKEGLLVKSYDNLQIEKRLKEKWKSLSLRVFIEMNYYVQEYISQGQFLKILF